MQQHNYTYQSDFAGSSDGAPGARDFLATMKPS